MGFGKDLQSVSLAGSRLKLIAPRLSSVLFLSSIETLEPQLRGLRRPKTPSAPHESVSSRGAETTR